MPRILSGQDNREQLHQEMAICEALERTVNGSETLALDSQSDREVLISRLKRALGFSA